MLAHQPELQQYILSPEEAGTHDPEVGYYIFRGMPSVDLDTLRGTTTDNVNFHENWAFALMYAGEAGMLIVAHVADTGLDHYTGSGWRTDFIRRDIARADAAQFGLAKIPENIREVTDAEIEALKSITPKETNGWIARRHTGVAWRRIAKEIIGHHFTQI